MFTYLLLFFSLPLQSLLEPTKGPFIPAQHGIQEMNSAPDPFKTTSEVTLSDLNVGSVW